jgi:hypothetical protein
MADFGCMLAAVSVVQEARGGISRLVQGATSWTPEVQFGQGDFSGLCKAQTGPGARRAPYVMGTVGCFYSSKAACPPGVEVKISGAIPSLPHTSS